MITPDLKAELLAELEKLPEENARALLEALRRNPERPIRHWSPAIGALSDEDAQQMMKAIEEAFEETEPAGPQDG